MSNPEKTKMDAEEKKNENSEDGSDYLSSDEERDIGELVLGLPALRVSESLNADAIIRNKAVSAADLIVAAAYAAAKTGSKATGSTVEGEPVKKVKKRRPSQLSNPPKGPPTCNVCGKGFISWKAVFGHLRFHPNRGYQGFHPPPTFNAAEEGFGGTTVAASSGGGGFGVVTGGLGIDLNAEPIEEEEGSGSGSAPKIDLNRSPPQEEEEKKDDKAE